MNQELKGTHVCPRIPSLCGYDDACALAAAYAKGEADPVGITTRCLDAAPTQTAVYISVTPDRALMEAEAARARYRAGNPLSPFDGVPLAWKDLFDVRGTVTTGGSDLYKNNPKAKEDGPLVTLAARAGMVCTGKLNTTEFAYSTTGTNPHFGNPVNPYSKDGAARIAGGSSSGSAVAVASGILPIAMGTDTGGSIRVPSAFNGLTGFKPTVGHYSREGVLFLARTVDTPGPIARSVRDVIVMDRILRGKPCHCRAPEPLSLKGRRFVVEKSLLHDEAVDPAARVMLESVGERLEKAGAFVAYRDVPMVREAMQIIGQGWFSGAESFTEIRWALDDPEKAERIDQRIRKRAETSRTLDPSLIVRSYWARHRLIDAIRKYLDGDILITQAVGHGAPLLNELLDNEATFFRYISANTRLCMPFNLMDMPGITLPAALDGNGMPLGVCLYGPSGADEKVLEAAFAAEQAITRIK